MQPFLHRIPGKLFEARPRVDMAKGTHLGWRWSKWRNGWMRRYPLCADCGSLAQCVHHIVPRHVDPSRIYDETNCVSLCRDCHDERHRRDRLIHTLSTKTEGG